MGITSIDIAALKEAFATKDDLSSGLASLREEMHGGLSAVIDRLEEIQDEMLQAFAMSEESIRREFAQREELDAVNERVARLERHLDAPHR